eukprot:363378-Chlamydomonas_euryale.AAC.24
MLAVLLPTSRGHLVANNRQARAFSEIMRLINWATTPPSSTRSSVRGPDDSMGAAADGSPECSPGPAGLRSRIAVAHAAAAAMGGAPGSRGKPASSARISLQFGGGNDAGDASPAGSAVASAAARNKHMVLDVAGENRAEFDDVNSPLAATSARDQQIGAAWQLFVKQSDTGVDIDVRSQQLAVEPYSYLMVCKRARNVACVVKPAQGAGMRPRALGGGQRDRPVWTRSDRRGRCFPSPPPHPCAHSHRVWAHACRPCWSTTTVGLCILEHFQNFTRSYIFYRHAVQANTRRACFGAARYLAASSVWRSRGETASLAFMPLRVAAQGGKHGSAPVLRLPHPHSLHKT